MSLFVWVITLDLSGMGDPTSSLRYHQHSSQDHVTNQAPPLLQSRDTFGGDSTKILIQNCRQAQNQQINRTPFEDYCCSRSTAQGSARNDCGLNWRIKIKRLDIFSVLIKVDILQAISPSSEKA